MGFKMPINGTVYRILAPQIPMFWEAIKFACVKADEVDTEQRPAYFNELLHALLSDKAQCFVSLDNNRRLIRIAITRIITDKITLVKELLIQCLYSIEGMDDETLQYEWKILQQFADKEKCKNVIFSSRNHRVWELGRNIGAKERYRSFVVSIGDK